MRGLCLWISTLWKQLFICFNFTLAAHGLLLGYVPWCHVIDVKRVYLAPFTAEAVVSRFYDTGNVSVHLWSATDRHHYYTLLQETQLDSPRATDALEVVRLREKLIVSEGSVLGVSIGQRETMRAEFDEEATLYVSDVCLHSTDHDHDVNETSQSVVSPLTEVGQVRRFLDLPLPYSLPLHLCTSLDCRESIYKLMDNEDELKHLHISRWELLELLRRLALTTWQPGDETTPPDVSDSAGATADDVSWRTDTKVTRALSGTANFSTDLVKYISADDNNTWTTDAHPAVVGNNSDISDTQQTALGVTEEWLALTGGGNFSGNGTNITAVESTLNVDDNSTFQLPPWLLPAWARNNDSFAVQSLLEELIEKYKSQTVRPPGTSITTQTFSGLPEADADKNINTSGTESMLNKSDSDLLRLLHCLPLWALRNDSFAQHSLLEEQIKRQIHEMIPVPPPGDCGSSPEQDASLSSLDESNAHYHTIIGLGIWNVVVTMLLFTVLVAVFIVCTNKRRSRLRFARSYMVTAYEPKASKATHLLA